MTIDDPLSILRGVGEIQAKKFAVLGIFSIGQLIDYFPKRYEDYSVITAISRLRPGAVTIEAKIKQVSGRYVRRGLHITEAVASDDSGSVRLTWFNQPYRAASLKVNRPYFISGQYELTHQRFTISNPNVEMVSDMPINTARILAVYRETKGLDSRQIRLAVLQLRQLIAKMPESLPSWLINEQKLLDRAVALRALHMPESADQLAAARHRLSFEEVFQLALASLINKRQIHSQTAYSIPFNQRLARNFVSQLPFKLTNCQRQSVWQIYLDMQKAEPMNRMLEGDVGSGKTVVATMAALMALAQGWQVAFMAPTELLARQHAETIYGLLKASGRENLVGLLVGSLNNTQKNKARKAIANGQIQFIIGTHALIQEQVDMHKLVLIIIDEQHRFGVEQRKMLMKKAGHMPHVLSLTATPIPRSLALTLYGELDISVLNEKPANRLPIVTKITSPNSRTQLYSAIDILLNDGQQMFVVCPLISHSALLDVQAAEKVYESFSQKDFKHRRIGLLHGKLNTSQKIKIMEQFIDKKIDILVSTTVIEVGVDVPNATIMLIESAERFGLAQLHQLRGRIGRGKHQGFCYLMLSDSRPASKRLRALESSTDGFQLAELDLELRGPGAIYGTSQHGLLDLRIAKLTDTALISAARTAANQFLDHGESIDLYPELKSRVYHLRAVTNLN